MMLLLFLACDSVWTTLNPPEDCSGAGYDFLLTWYADADGDGYGDVLTRKESCFAPSGYVLADGDCAPEDPAISRG